MNLLMVFLVNGFETQSLPSAFSPAQEVAWEEETMERYPELAWRLEEDQERVMGRLRRFRDIVKGSNMPVSFATLLNARPYGLLPFQVARAFETFLVLQGLGHPFSSDEEMWALLQCYPARCPSFYRLPHSARHLLLESLPEWTSLEQILGE